ncbi:MAG: GlsB/YeaQ/YmgE family stress response membrane protein [Ktedonobacterales bacterium]|nr:GlsB/YeaQ/YmgE family stress response membrane protein [Ktedonobacterales bacterium]
MVFLAVTVTFSDLVLQIIVGAIAAGITGRAMRGAGFGILGDLLFGIVGAVAANFVVNYFGLFNIGRFGLPGELIIAIIGAVLLVVIVRLFTSGRTTHTDA